MNGQELWEVIEGLQESHLLQYTHLLTGYIGSVSFLETVVKIVKALREKNPDLVYGIDPLLLQISASQASQAASTLN